jgi:hypothetical protein
MRACSGEEAQFIQSQIGGKSNFHFHPLRPTQRWTFRDINRGTAMKLGLIDRDRQVSLKEVAADCVSLGIPKMAKCSTPEIRSTPRLSLRGRTS